jgi:hypothetical protein
VTVYRHTSIQTLSTLADGALVLVGGRFQRRVLGCTLSDANHSVPLIAQPFSWAPGDGQMVELWGQVLAGPQPRILVHDARPLGTTRSIQPLTVPQVGTRHLVLRVVRYASQHMGVTASHQHYLLLWPDAREGLHVISGNVSGLSPPYLEVISAVPILTS